jgi:hypothetical protein
MASNINPNLSKHKQICMLCIGLYRSIHGHTTSNHHSRCCEGHLYSCCGFQPAVCKLAFCQCKFVSSVASGTWSLNARRSSTRPAWKPCALKLTSVAVQVTANLEIHNDQTQHRLVLRIACRHHRTYRAARLISRGAASHRGADMRLKN